MVELNELAEAVLKMRTAASAVRPEEFFSVAPSQVAQRVEAARSPGRWAAQTAGPYECSHCGYAGPITIGFEDKGLTLYPNGGLLARDHGNGDRDSSIYINARKLISQLDAYNVSFGNEPGSVAQG